MAKTDFKSVDEYMASLPAETQRILRQVFDAIRSTVPDAEAAISYQMPVFKLGDASMLFVAGWKKHWSLYPAGRELVATFGEELAPYQVEKGTIRFPLSRPVPTGLIERIARFRAGEVEAGGGHGGRKAD